MLSPFSCSSTSIYSLAISLLGAALNFWSMSLCPSQLYGLKDFFIHLSCPNIHRYSHSTCLFDVSKLFINKMFLICLSLPESQINPFSFSFFLRSHWVFLGERETGAQTRLPRYAAPVVGKCLAPVTARRSSRMRQNFSCMAFIHFYIFWYNDHFTKLLI